MTKPVKIILVTAIILIVATLGFTLWPKEIQIDNKDLTPELLIANINESFFGSGLQIKKGFANWILDNGNRICLEDGSYVKLDDINTDLIKQSNKEISSFLRDLGFRENRENRLEEKSYEQDARIGFEKGNIKCAIIWSLDEDFYLIRCANLKKQDEINYNTFYDLVNTENRKNALICVEKQKDRYAMGSIGFWRTGAKWYAKKENGNWDLLLITQDALQCSFAEQLPEGFYTNDFCYDGE